VDALDDSSRSASAPTAPTQRGGGVSGARGGSGGAVCATVAVSRCLLYLGDLSRYASLHTPGPASAKDWGASAGYYAAAARLFPGGGNPHNQLAVLATYTGDELCAAYRYARAQACATPFATARENMGLLLDQARGGAAGAGGGGDGATPTSAPDGTAAVAAFVRALAALFQRTPGAADAADGALRALDGALAAPPAAAALLCWGPLGSPPPALHMLATALCAELSRGWAAPGAPPATGVAAASAAATLLFGLSSRLLRRAAAEASAPPPRGPALAAALPLLEWAASAPADALPPPGAPVAEARACGECWAAAAALLNALQHAGVAPPLAQQRGAPVSSAALAEDYELRGLTALAPAHSALRFGTFRDFAAATAAAAAGEAADAHAARGARALAAGARIAAAGGPTGAPPLLRSPATGRFAAAGDAAHAPFAQQQQQQQQQQPSAGLWAPPPHAPQYAAAAPLPPAPAFFGREPLESVGALIDASERDDAAPPPFDDAMDVSEQQHWRALPPPGAPAASLPPPGFSLFGGAVLVQPPAAPPPLPSSGLMSRALPQAQQPPPPAPPMGGMAGAMRAPPPGFAGPPAHAQPPPQQPQQDGAPASWSSGAFPLRGGSSDSELPLPFPGLLAAAMRAPPPGACGRSERVKRKRCHNTADASACRDRAPQAFQRRCSTRGSVPPVVRSACAVELPLMWRSVAAAPFALAPAEASCDEPPRTLRCYSVRTCLAQPSTGHACARALHAHVCAAVSRPHAAAGKTQALLLLLPCRRHAAAARLVRAAGCRSRMLRWRTSAAPAQDHAWQRAALGAPRRSASHVRKQTCVRAAKKAQEAWVLRRTDRGGRGTFELKGAARALRARWRLCQCICGEQTAVGDIFCVARQR
jgi:hypothetical protein